MISAERREMFSDLYRLAEYYEAPEFKPGAVEDNANWFIKATEEQLAPFLRKHKSILAVELAMSVVEECSQRAAAKNKEV